MQTGMNENQMLFQSTPSPRRETLAIDDRPNFFRFQSTPSPRRETKGGGQSTAHNFISIHSLPKEGDTIVLISTISKNRFQSTPSPRRETTTKSKKETA